MPDASLQRKLRNWQMLLLDLTRARRNVKLISSIMPEDIDLTRTQSLGSKLLREYMFYARDGVASLGSVPAGLREAAGGEAIPPAHRGLIRGDQSSKQGRAGRKRSP